MAPEPNCRYCGGSGRVLVADTYKSGRLDSESFVCWELAVEAPCRCVYER